MTILRTLSLRFLLPLALTGGLLALVVQPAQANGVPQLVKLVYLENLSNWGPQDAEGVLEFSFAEGFLSLEVDGMPRLIGQAYEGWLVRSSTNEAISVGQFNATSAGRVRYEVQLPPITDYSLDLFMITVQSLSDPIDDPSQNRSIGGFFSVLSPPEPPSVGGDVGAAGAGAGGTGGADGSSSSSGADGAEATSTGESPDRLPETGDSTSFIGGLRGISLIVAGGMLLLWATARTRQRMNRGGTQ